MTKPLSELWSLLTEPSPRVIDRSARRSARTLAAFVLLGLALSPPAFLLKIEVAEELLPALPFLRLLLLPTVLAYVLSRTRYFRAGVLLEISLVWAGATVTVLVTPLDLVALCFLILPVMLSAAMLDLRSTQVIAGLCILTDIALVSLTPGSDRMELLGSQLFMCMTIGLILYIRLNQDLIAAERKLALEASVANHQELLSSTFDGTALHVQGRIVDADETFAQLFGLNQGEVIYNPIDSFFPDREQGKLEKLISEGSGRPVELMINHAENRSCWIEMVCQRQIDPIGEDIEILAARDVTDRKTMQQQFLFAGRMVAMGTMAAGVAHEINNPLTYIMGHQQLLGRELKPMLKDHEKTDRERVQHRLHIIREGVDRVKQIVSDLKTFSRSDDESVSVVDLQQVAETAIQMTWNEIRHRAQLVRVFEKAPPVEASTAHLGQVMINLLVNAAQALPEDGGKRMRITLSIGTAQDGRAFLSVADTGPGIPEHELTHIFEPFFTTKPIGQGTGLGLSICHSIIRRYGGEITVQSSSDGSVFEILLPPSSKPLPRTIPLEVEPIEPHTHSQGKVLVVDDEPEIAQLLQEMLYELDVTVAKDGQEALECWHDQDFDVVVCDLMMPRVSGMDVYHSIKKIEPGKEQKLLFITGGAFTPATQDFLEDLQRPWLQKPFSPRQLRDMVLRLIREASSMEQDSSDPTD